MANWRDVQGWARGWRCACLAAALLPLIGAAAAKQTVQRPMTCAKYHAENGRASCVRRLRFDRDALVIAQISPAIRRARALYLDEPPSAGYWRSVMRRKRQPDLVEALLEPPNPATIPILRSYNIPIIPNLPPIFFLQYRSAPVQDDATTE
jgi:hypothetical protein